MPLMIKLDPRPIIGYRRRDEASISTDDKLGCVSIRVQELDLSQSTDEKPTDSAINPPIAMAVSGSCMMYDASLASPTGSVTMELPSPQEPLDQKAAMDIMMYGDSLESPTSAVSMTLPPHTCQTEEAASCFMDLPLEIRSQIYKWVHLMHPLKKHHFTPWSNTPIHNKYQGTNVVPIKNQKIVPSWCSPAAMEILNKIPGAVTSRPERTVEEKEDDAALMSGKPLCGVPTALLQVSKEVYWECRQVPFLTNEFVFVNHLTSGLWAARLFVNGMKPWQREAMRYARLELWSQDMSGAQTGEWMELCQAWSESLRELRVKIASPMGTFRPTRVGERVVEETESDVQLSDADMQAEEWLASGLKTMRQIEYIEVELALPGWRNEKKLNWCRALKKNLLAARPAFGKALRIACVERSS